MTEPRHNRTRRGRGADPISPVGSGVAAAPSKVPRARAGAPRLRVKICCIASLEEARLAVRAGASAVGLVSEMPSGPGVIPESRIAEIAAGVPPEVETFLLTSRRSPEEIIAQHRRCRTTTIQLCDRLPPGTLSALRRALPGVSLVQVIHVTGPEAVEEAREVGPSVDALLLDSGRPSAAVKELGGTGRVHDWTVSREIRSAVDVPVYLAGGLRPENVPHAARTVRPYGVDVCSGLRVDGRLDDDLLGAFMTAVREGV